MIKGRIDVSKVNKDKFYKTDKGTVYLDIVLIETTNSKYGDDYMIVQDVPKEERLAGKKGNILGNAKIFTKDNAHRAAAPAAKPTVQTPDDDVPF